MAFGGQMHHHFTATVERVPGIFSINQSQQQQLQFIRYDDNMGGINSRTGYAR